MNKFTHLLLPVLIMSTCGCTHESKSTSPITSDSKIVSPSKNTTDTIRVIDNDYISKILKQEFKPRRYINKHLIKSYTLEKNENDNSIQDTVATYQNKLDFYKVYLTGDKHHTDTLLIEFKLNSTSMILPEDIKVGSSKDNITKFFKTKGFNKTLIISEDEGYQNLYLSFKEDILTSIYFTSSYIH